MVTAHSESILVARLGIVAEHHEQGTARDNSARRRTTGRAEALLKKIVRVIDVEGKAVVGATVVPWAVRSARSWHVERRGASGQRAANADHRR